LAITQSKVARRCGEVLLLAEEVAQHQPLVASGLPNLVHGLQEHAAGPAGRVVDGLAGLRGEHAHHELDDRSRRVELAGLAVGEVSELSYAWPRTSLGTALLRRSSRLKWSIRSTSNSSDRRALLVHCTSPKIP
jgi:hypothetical protein